MSTLNYNQIHFLKSAHNSKHLPPDTLAEVAFAGRSNAGKSSALNVITGNKGLARTSKTPGRTQLINFFELKTGQRLVDLPGYGYAKVPDKIKAHWQIFLTEYLLHRESLKGLILLMDIRHPLTPLDWQLIEWLKVRALPIHILLTKSDKLKSGAAKSALLTIKKNLTIYANITVQLFSSLKKIGIEEVQQKLDAWLQETL